MKPLEVECPECKSMCGVEVGEKELVEGMETEGYEAQCDACGCKFSFNVYVDIFCKTKL